MSGVRRPRHGALLLALVATAIYWTRGRDCAWAASSHGANGIDAPTSHPGSHRRALLAGLLPLALSSSEASAVGNEKVVVLGGSGFVGRRICERLVADGASVVSVSKSGTPPVGAGAWASKVQWVKGDVTSMDLASAVEGAEAVVSAIGAIGSGDDEAANGLTAERAVAAATTAKAKRFVLVSATPLVKDAGIGGIFPGYAAGKRRAEAAVSTFPGSTLVLQPTFIYGGETFSATPPRVAEWYGEQIEGLLGTGLVRGVASVSPAALKLALLPPSSVADVASAAAAGALGSAEGVLSSHDEIQAAARRL